MAAGTLVTVNVEKSIFSGISPLIYIKNTGAVAVTISTENPVVINAGIVLAANESITLPLAANNSAIGNLRAIPNSGSGQLSIFAL